MMPVHSHRDDRFAAVASLYCLDSPTLVYDGASCISVLILLSPVSLFVLQNETHSWIGLPFNQSFAWGLPLSHLQIANLLDFSIFRYAAVCRKAIARYVAKVWARAGFELWMRRTRPWTCSIVNGLGLANERAFIPSWKYLGVYGLCPLSFGMPNNDSMNITSCRIVHLHGTEGREVGAAKATWLNETRAHSPEKQVIKKRSPNQKPVQWTDMISVIPVCRWFRHRKGAFFHIYLTLLGYIRKECILCPNFWQENFSSAWSHGTLMTRQIHSTGSAHESCWRQPGS